MLKSKRIYLLLFFIFKYAIMQAQTTLSTPVGEYYLRGVMETACGFKLNEDSTFQFFFSYGALDRQGEGKWLVKGNDIIFNSKEKPAQDFAMLTPQAGEKDKITIQVKEANPMILKHIYCKIKGRTGEQEGMADDKGTIHFNAQPVETIELVFEFCSEKKSVFHVKDGAHHSFSFKPQPWLMEVFFQNFHLSLTKDGLTGGHPFSNEKTFHYEKTGH